MTLSKPYRRIIRPFTDGDYIHGGDDEQIYILSNDYASDRSMLIRAYHLIERDVLRIFEYIEPCDANLATYSHRTYELLIRASTEFETNCKGILSDNRYINPTRGNLNIMDYYKIDKASRLSEYRVTLDTWFPRGKVFEPFKDWITGHSLAWYQSYNDVKHNRSTEFSKASLENVMASVAGLLVILFSQFYVFVFNPYQTVGGWSGGDDGSIYLESSLFRIVPPTTWALNEQYDFDWDRIKALGSPFDNFSF